MNDRQLQDKWLSAEMASGEWLVPAKTEDEDVGIHQIDEATEFKRLYTLTMAVSGLWTFVTPISLHTVTEPPRFVLSSPVPPMSVCRISGRLCGGTGPRPWGLGSRRCPR